MITDEDLELGWISTCLETSLCDDNYTYPLTTIKITH
jgi:hypothetical protein